MSMDDDMYDMEAFVEERKSLPEWDMHDTWDRIANYIANLELAHDGLQKENNELRMAIKVMMGIKEEKKSVRRGPSPYDAGANRGLKR